MIAASRATSADCVSFSWQPPLLPVRFNNFQSVESLSARHNRQQVNQTAHQEALAQQKTIAAEDDNRHQLDSDRREKQHAEHGVDTGGFPAGFQLFVRFAAEKEEGDDQQEQRRRRLRGGTLLER